MDYLYNVATKKEVLVTIRISENTRDEFKIAAELRGSTMSGLLHQWIIRTIREEKQMSPQNFQPRHIAPVVATITPAVDPKDEIRERLKTGMPLATHSHRKMPTKLDEINTQAKRKTR